MKYCETCHTTYPSDFSICPKDRGALRSVSDLAPGMTVRDRYIILEKIGSGGMGTVYKARHRVFGELRALKLISATLVAEPLFLERFETEAKIARRLQHPNAVRVDDIDRTEDGRPFLVMEYVEGPSLRDVLERETFAGKPAPLPLARVLRIGREVAAALAAAHQLGIVHRDIKPENILAIRTPDGAETVKVFDFGIAKIRPGYHTSVGGAGGVGSTPTVAGTVLGTPQYMSPEQAEGLPGDSIDGRADLYSLGVVLYEAMTGSLPFQAETMQQWIRHHLGTVPVAPDRERPDLGIPPAVGALVMKALEKRREDRFADAEEMMAALDAAAVAAAEAAASADSTADVTPLAVTVIHTPPSSSPSTTPPPSTPPPMTWKSAEHEYAVRDFPSPESAMEFVAQEPIAQTVPGRSPTPIPPKEAATPAPKPRSKFMVMVAVLLLAALGVGGAMLWRARDQQPVGPRASVQFRLVAGPWTKYLTPAQTFPNRFQLKGTNPAQMFVLEPEAIVDEKAIQQASVTEENGRPALLFTLTPAGGEKMRKATSDNIGTQMGIVAGGELLQVAIIQSTISDQLVLTGNLTAEELKALADRINGTR
ncbi:MAG: protein kinase [Acidobacteriota bacterium]|nr:protein kinase [Acidobacteriota bacterium]